MSSRELRIKILASVDGFQAGMAKAQQGLSDFDKAIRQSAERREAINSLGNSFGAIGLVAAAAGVTAVKSFADFDAAMSAVKATGDDAAESIDALRQAAMDAGAETAFSATESAAAIENLAKAGVSAADILGGGLDGALSLAAAGGLDVASAAEIAAIAMTQFGLAGADIPHVADLLAAAAGKANGEVSDMGMALQQSGLVAAQMGLSIEETTGTLAAFAQAGLLGSDAGTSLKTMLQRLANPSKEAADLMKKFGIEAYDASGNLVSMTELAGQLETAFVGQTQATRDAAMAQIFGSDAIRAANVLYSEGAVGIATWTAEVNDAGYAADTARTRMDNLKGDIELLTGSLETALIKTGTGANDVLRDMVQNVTTLVDGYGELPAPVQESTLRFLALSAALGLGGFATTRAITGFADMANTLDRLSDGAGKLTRSQLFARGGAALAGTALAAVQPMAQDANEALGILTTTASGAAIGFAAFGPAGATIGTAAGATWGVVEALSASKDAADDAAAAGRRAALEQQVAWEALGTTLDGVGAKITETTRKAAASQLQENGTAALASSLGIELRTLTDVALAVPGALEQLDAAMATSANTPTAAKAYLDLRQQVTGLSSEFLTVRNHTVAANLAAVDYATVLNGIPDSVQTEIKARNFQYTQDEILELQRLYGLTPEQVETFMLIRDDGFQDQYSYLSGQLATLDQYAAHPDALLNDLATGNIQSIMGALGLLDVSGADPIASLVDNATGPLTNLSSYLLGLDGQSATVTVNARLTGLAGALAGPGSSQALRNLGFANGGILNYANGGIVDSMAWARDVFDRADRFASGGFSENHVAQIAPAGSWRIWAEDETPGEAWIPTMKETA